MPAPGEPTPEALPPAAPTPGAPAPGAPKPGLGTGVGIGVGTGIGCGASLLALILMVLTGFAGWGASFLGLTWPFLLLGLVSIVLLLFKRTRPIAIGMLIIAAAVWIVFLGPCIALLGV
ncbi:hypothetical protein [Agromyces terreus]|uniref:hypothetical protein n=1 Tax=Agromyces terreus TaxID=424795 RepID=UPI0031DA670D